MPVTSIWKTSEQTSCAKQTWTDVTVHMMVKDLFREWWSHMPATPSGFFAPGPSCFGNAGAVAALVGCCALGAGRRINITTHGQSWWWECFANPSWSLVQPKVHRSQSTIINPCANTCSQHPAQPTDVIDVIHETNQPNMCTGLRALWAWFANCWAWFAQHMGLICYPKAWFAISWAWFAIC